MPDEATPSPAEGAPEITPAEPPSDFRSYVKWRETGALPPREEEVKPATAVAEEQPPVKTDPQSGADDHAESEEEGDKRPNGRVRKIDKLTRELEQLKAQLALVQTPKPAQPEAEKAAE